IFNKATAPGSSATSALRISICDKPRPAGQSSLKLKRQLSYQLPLETRINLIKSALKCSR
ncbi:TPA: hypothetical protein ACIUG1_000673, partial [Salmonella enterica subsp. enterica serovar Rough:-:-]